MYMRVYFDVWLVFIVGLLCVMLCGGLCVLLLVCWRWGMWTGVNLEEERMCVGAMFRGPRSGVETEGDRQSVEWGKCGWVVIFCSVYVWRALCDMGCV